MKAEKISNKTIDLAMLAKQENSSDTKRQVVPYNNNNKDATKLCHLNDSKIHGRKSHESLEIKQLKIVRIHLHSIQILADSEDEEVVIRNEFGRKRKAFRNGVCYTVDAAIGRFRCHFNLT
uniref:Uncharacterized protein n=1 Tax=Glossina austeni TaxID=7395 RepID=A0A1A9UVG2_GLOAU